MQCLRFAPALLAAAIAALPPPPAAAADWLQFGYDAAHSGFNPADRGDPTAAGNTILWHYALPGRADVAPVYLGNVATPVGQKNLLFIVAVDGTLLALDADSSNLHIVWSRQPAGAAGTKNGAAAAIDPNRQYVYAFGLDGKVHKYNVGDGGEVLDGGWPQVSTLKPDQEKGASDLAIATAQNGHTYLYAVTSGHADDASDFQGHVTAIDLGSGAQAVFNAQCSDLAMHFVAWGTVSGPGKNDCQRIGSGNSGMWSRAGAVYDAALDRLFITTGNGLFDPFDAAGNGMDWGDSVVALHADASGAGAGMPLDSYTPPTYGSDDPKMGLQGYDVDLGATAIAIVPAPAGTAAAWQHLGVQGGKDGCVRLLNLADLSGQGGPGHVGGELQFQDFPGGSHCTSGLDMPEIKTQPAVWVNPDDGASWVYVATDYDGLAAYKVVLDGAGKPSLAMQWTGHSSTSPIVANGYLYQADTHLWASDAVTGANATADASAWSTVYADPHWQSPILVNGHIYLIDGNSATQSSSLWVYQLDGTFRDGFDKVDARAPGTGAGPSR
jgi:hypothetical protein